MLVLNPTINYTTLYSSLTLSPPPSTVAIKPVDIAPNSVFSGGSSRPGQVTVDKPSEGRWLLI